LAAAMPLLMLLRTPQEKRLRIELKYDSLTL
jgi:hypothetical protein